MSQHRIAGKQGISYRLGLVSLIIELDRVVIGIKCRESSRRKLGSIGGNWHKGISLHELHTS